MLSTGARRMSVFHIWLGEEVLAWWIPKGRTLVKRVGAVVVAGLDIGVDVAEADEVVAVLVAGVDAGLVARDTGVDDAEKQTC